MAPPLRLIAIGIVAAALLLAIVAAGTNAWAVVSFGSYKIEFGVFKYCGFDRCEDTIGTLSASCGDHTQAGVNSRLRAAQGFSVLAILVGIVCLIAVVFRHLLAAQSVPSFAEIVGRIVEKVPPMVDMVAAIFCGMSMLVAFAVFANLYGSYLYCDQSYCDYYKSVLGADTSCGLNYSFAFAILSWLLFSASAGVIFMSNRNSEGYSGISSQQQGTGAPPPYNAVAV